MYFTSSCPNTPTLPSHAHPWQINENKLIVEKYCYYVLKRCKRYHLVKKWNDSIVNSCQYFILKVGVIGQVGGHIWAGNQYISYRTPDSGHFSHNLSIIQINYTSPYMVWIIKFLLYLYISYRTPQSGHFSHTTHFCGHQTSRRFSSCTCDRGRHSKGVSLPVGKYRVWWCHPVVI